MNKYQNLLMGIAIGDAFGIAYEFMDKKELESEFDFTRYKAHPVEGIGNLPGHYTDDTQMSIAVSEALISRASITKALLADYFVRAYKRDPRNGYGKGMKIVLPQVNNGKELLTTIRPHSERNGAAMRAAPFGVLKNEKEVIEAALVNASVTHDTPNGRFSSACMALASHYFLYRRGSAENLFEYCVEYTDGIDPDSTAHMHTLSKMRAFNPESGIPCDGRLTAGAVVYVVSRFPDTASVLKEAVRLGGDTDSVAALATGIKAIASGLDSLPEFLVRDLENGTYGRAYLLKLGDALSELL